VKLTNIFQDGCCTTNQIVRLISKMFQGHSKHRHDQTARTRRSKNGALGRGAKIEVPSVFIWTAVLEESTGNFWTEVNYIWSKIGYDHFDNRQIMANLVPFGALSFQSLFVCLGFSCVSSHKKPRVLGFPGPLSSPFHVFGWTSWVSVLVRSPLLVGSRWPLAKSQRLGLAISE